MADPNLSTLLKWSVENSSASAADPAAAPPKTNLTPEALAALFGGPSDADLMISSMQAITSTDPEFTIENKLIAFDNFEQLIENLDNANNLGPLELWSPLLGLLEHENGEIKMMAAWCVGTAVQNNVSSQERFVASNGVEKLVKVAMGKEEGSATRRKACYAISSAVRNYQPAMDVLVKALGEVDGWKGSEVIQGDIDASDMEAVDVVIGRLREEAKGEKV